jgi:signal peptidase
MTGSKEQEKIRNLFREFRESKNPVISFARDILWVVVVVGCIALTLYLVSGTWPAVVAIESESMLPNMHVGDLVFVVQKDRFGELQTWDDGVISGYAKFADSPDRNGNMPFGDVIIYRPNGDSGVHPIIHRAISWFEDPLNSGYITKGDNNPVVDQNTVYSGIGKIEPVKEEWIVGKAYFAIPLVGYLPLHLIEFAVFILVLMALHELYLRSKEGNKPENKKRLKKRRK